MRLYLPPLAGFTLTASSALAQAPSASPSADGRIVGSGLVVVGLVIVAALVYFIVQMRRPWALASGLPK